MLADQADNAPVAPVPDAATDPSAFDKILAPDPLVLHSARLRLASHFAASVAHYPEATSHHPMDDVGAVSAVIEAARNGADRPADPLDVGAALVVLGNMRLYLDRLEADLLDGAQQVGLGWDVVAAIIGIPASAAQHRHSVLRARRELDSPG
jgi:hypothetical protein